MICNTCGAYSNGIKVVAWVCSCSEAEAIKKIERALQDPEARSVRVPKPRPLALVTKKQYNNVAARNIDRIYAELLPLTAPEAKPARRYIRNRGLRIDDHERYNDSLFYHPSLYYKDRADQSTGYSPAIVAKVYRGSELVNLHRTYITQNGRKAPISTPKMLMSPVYKGATSGAAIQLDTPDRVLHVAEGIETALAVHQAVNEPVWAAISAGGMERLIVPPSVTRVVIWTDLDRSGRGLQAAKALNRRLHRLDVSVSIKLPERDLLRTRESVDWLDVLNMEAES